MWLSWRWSLAFAVLFTGVAARLRRDPRRTSTVPLVTELGFMFGLYTLWRICGQLSVMGVERALARGEAVWRIERLLRLPNEVVIQRWILPHRWLGQSANAYYAVAHAPALGIFLIWMFFRHRDAYPRARNTLALLTFSCLLIELIPVAPPRLLPRYGFVDLAREYGLSVYSATLGPDSFNQLSAMPSVHVGWAVLIAWFTWRNAAGRGRWLGVAHAAVTIVVVTVTANHWLLDGIVAVGLLVGADVIAGRLHRRAVTRTQMVGRSEVNATTSTMR